MASLDFIRNNLKFYDKIRPKNPDQSYTVLATINDYKTGELIAIATGTQASLRVYPNDIEDCHAESLVKRAYKRYLIDKILYLSNSRGEKDVHKLTKECQQELTLFVSQFPCGLLKRYEGDEPIDAVTGNVIKRKPGRGTVIDGKTIYVERDNCLNKLRKWVSGGLQGERIGRLLGIKNRIVKIVIGNCESGTDVDHKSLLDLFKSNLSSDDSLEYELAQMRRNDLVFISTKQPQPVALVWWAQSSGVSPIGKHEFVADGRKMGLTKKQCLTDKNAYRLRISNHCLLEDLYKILALVGVTS